MSKSFQLNSNTKINIKTAESNNNQSVDGLEILNDAFLGYSSFVLQRRALPDVRDNLRYTQRQILYAALKEKLVAPAKHKKTLKMVSAAMSRYYVHGDASCVGQIYRMGNLASRYKLIDVMGNAGGVTNNSSYAAPRYTESRLSLLSAKMFEHIKDNVLTINNWAPSYDEEDEFPLVLPSIGYYNLCNGLHGGLGLVVSNIPQFNISEMNAEICKLIDNPEYIPDILPDFNSGGILLNPNTTKATLAEGEGKSIWLRGEVQYGNGYIDITSLPYGVYSDTVVAQLAKFEERKTSAFIKFKDLSDKSVKIRVYTDESLDKLEKWLYKNTSVQNFFMVKMNMLDGGTTPKLFPLKEAILEHISHSKLMFTRHLEHEIATLKARLNIIEGLLRAYSILDDIIVLIKASNGRADAIEKLINKYDFNKPQAEAIVDLKLHRLSSLDITKLMEEKETNLENTQAIENILLNEVIFNDTLKSIYEQVANEFGDNRKTKIFDGEDYENAADGSLAIKDFKLNADFIPDYLEGETTIALNETLVIITNKARSVLREAKTLQMGVPLAEQIKLKDDENIIKILLNQEIKELEQHQDNCKILLITNEGKFTIHPSYLLARLSERGKRFTDWALTISDLDIVHNSVANAYSPLKRPKKVKEKVNAGNFTINNDNIGGNKSFRAGFTYRQANSRK